MIDIKKIRDDVAAYKLICQKRNMNIDVDWVLALDDERKQLQFSIDQAKAEQKQLASQQDYEWAKNLKVKIQELEAQHTEIAAQLEKMLLKMPNTSLDPKIPVGKDDSENVVAEVFWEIPQFWFEPQSHIDLMKKLDLVDFERGVKIGGARTYFLKWGCVAIYFEETCRKRIYSATGAKYCESWMSYGDWIFPWRRGGCLLDGKR